MATIVTMYRRIFPFHSQPSESQLTTSQTMKEKTFTSLLIPFESYVVFIQSILIWEKPYLSAIGLFVVNVLFWLIVSYSQHFYSLLAMACIIVFVYKTWVFQIWPEIREQILMIIFSGYFDTVPPSEDEDAEEWTPVHPQVLSVPEISRYLALITSKSKHYYEWLRELRREKPGTFCVLMTSTLSVLAVLGQYISGVLLAYIILMSVMLGPGLIIHILPRAPQISWVDLKNMFSLPPVRSEETRRAETDVELEEFLPETNSEVLEALNSPLESSEHELDDTTLMARELGMEDLIDEDSNGLSPSCDLIEMPAGDQDSIDDMESPEFALDSETASRDNSNNEIKFVPTHFKDSDSDSEEEAKFSQGLDFPEQENLDTQPSRLSSSSKFLISTIASNMAQISSVGQTLMASVLSSALSDTTNKTTEASSSTSAVARQQSDVSDIELTDYEIVSESELIPTAEDE